MIIRYKSLRCPGVQGKVSWVDTQDEWVVFNLGHDDAIRPGHELNWIRAGRQAKKLGGIRVIAVDYDQAIGRVINERAQGTGFSPGTWLPENTPGTWPPVAADTLYAGRTEPLSAGS